MDDYDDEEEGLGGGERGCGSRKKGCVYLECPLSDSGLPIEHFIVDPPLDIDLTAYGVTPVGVKLFERNGVWHVLDWVAVGA